MLNDIKKNKYYIEFNNLNTNKHNNFKIFNQKYDNLIKTFPYKNFKDYEYFMNILLSDINNLKLFKYLFNNINQNKIKSIIITINNNFEQIKSILPYIKNIKKIILGIIWNILGYYLSLLIIIKLNINIKLDIENILTNKYYLFLTCCYIYYDDLLDNKKNNKYKKFILNYTNFFFKNIDNYENIDNLLNDFIINKNINKNIFENVNNILNIFFIEYKKNNNKFILKSIEKLFNIEILCSKKQKNNEDLLSCTIFKSYNSLFCILQIILYNIDCNNNIHIKNNLYLYGLLSQLLDDFNDIISDKYDNINTLFTNNNSLNENILKLLKLIYKYNDNYSYHILNILIFNYGLVQSDFNIVNKKLLLYVPFSKEYLLNLRNFKNNNIYRLNNKLNIDFIINKSILFYKIINILNNNINKIYFRLLLKTEIYIKKKYIKNLNNIY